MSKTRRNHSLQFNAKVALEALQSEKTIHENDPFFKIGKVRLGRVPDLCQREAGYD